MMTYDFAGPWTKKAANHTALRSAKPSDDTSLEASVANLKREGVPASKLVAGVAMYGRGFDGVKADGSYAKPWPNEDGSVPFKDIDSLTGMMPARFNRLVVYRGSLLHSAVVNPQLSISADPRKGRLTLNSFYDF